MIIEWCNPNLQKHSFAEAIIFNQNGLAVGFKVIVTKVEEEE